ARYLRRSLLTSLHGFLRQKRQSAATGQTISVRATMVVLTATAGPIHRTSSIQETRCRRRAGTAKYDWEPLSMKAMRKCPGPSYSFSPTRRSTSPVPKGQIAECSLALPASSTFTTRSDTKSDNLRNDD